jgi:hypothetical protein
MIASFREILIIIHEDRLQKRRNEGSVDLIEVVGVIDVRFNELEHFLFDGAQTADTGGSGGDRPLGGDCI